VEAERIFEGIMDNCFDKFNENYITTDPTNSFLL
jgi:hypothetical protein